MFKIVKSKIIISTVLILFATDYVALGQSVEKQVHSREQLWLGAFNQTRFSQRWGLWLDVHYRSTGNFVDRPFQFLFRPAVTYFIKDNLRANFGYALVQHYPAKGFSTTRAEHRPWQQIWWNQKYPGASMLQWIRLEQRFNEKIVADEKQDGYNYNFRVRYNLAFLLPLTGKEIKTGTPFAAIMNEVFLNFGSNITFNTFDQNRLFGGVGYQFNPHLSAHLGYLNVYQQESSGNSYMMTHGLRLFLFHSLDIRNQDE